ncbi:Phospholipid-transporting ATPase 1 [Hordeum vulgare]|nr:Phospholipid-transporting ATPase 1 [Hordeum vulgare]
MMAPSTPAPAPIYINATSVGLDLDGFSLYREFSEDYELGEEDELDIDGVALFEDELANQAIGVKPKRKSRRTKVWSRTSSFVSVGWTLGKTPRWMSISKRWKVIQQECNKFCATFKSIKALPMSGIGMQDMAFKALEIPGPT